MSSAIGNQVDWSATFEANVMPSTVLSSRARVISPCGIPVACVRDCGVGGDQPVRRSFRFRERNSFTIMRRT
jgi:hypothetical protein